MSSPKTLFNSPFTAFRARNSKQERDDKAIDNAWNKLSVGERRHYQERARLICKPPSAANADSDLDDSVSERCSSRATNDDSEIGAGLVVHAFRKDFVCQGIDFVDDHRRNLWLSCHGHF